jgi:hypothetical protein
MKAIGASIAHTVAGTGHRQGLRVQIVVARTTSYSPWSATAAYLPPRRTTALCHSSRSIRQCGRRRRKLLALQRYVTVRMGLDS